MRFPWSSKPRRARRKPLVQAPFFGREPLLAALDEHLQAARQGAPQYVALLGPSGIGKSALLTEFALMRGAAPEVIMVQLHLGDYLLAREFYAHLFEALRKQSEKILNTLFNDTKRLRRVLSMQWDETEFRQVLISADWAQLQEPPQYETRPIGARSDPLRQLLTSVRQHPWAVGAATILDTVSPRVVGKGLQEPGLQRWAALLHGVQSRRLPDGAVLVLVLDQLSAGPSTPADIMEQWRYHWRAFVDVTREHMLPLLVVWAGTSDSLSPMQQAISDTVPLTVHAVEALPEEAYQQLTIRLRRALPRPMRESWQRTVTDHAERFRHPGSLILAATWLAAMTRTQTLGDDGALSVVQADDTVFVNDLVERIAQRHLEAGELFQQFLRIWAFLTPGRTFVMDDVLPMCDLYTLGLDPAAGRAKLEALLGDCARYGLLTYDVYKDRYTTSHEVVQDILQHRVCPEAYERQMVARRRRLAAAITHHMQRGDRDLLGELARALEADDEADDISPLATYVVPPLRRILAQSSKDERHRMAQALGTFRSSLAVDLLMLLLNDREATVRSGAAQSLADLGEVETLPALLKACQDSNSDVRWIAVAALGKLEEQTTVDTLIDMLTDEDKEVGRIAAQGLGTKGDVRAVPPLIAALRDTYSLLRETAALALGQLADPRALPALQELLQDENRQVRESAGHALAQLSASSC